MTDATHYDNDWALKSIAYARSFRKSTAEHKVAASVQSMNAAASNMLAAMVELSRLYVELAAEVEALGARNPKEHVYFALDRSGNEVKIGRSINVPKRVKALERERGTALHVLGTIEGGSDVEAALHRMFAKWRTSGEWFTACDEVMAAAAKCLDFKPIEVAA